MAVKMEREREYNDNRYEITGLFINVDLKYVVLRMGRRNGCPRFRNEYCVGLCASNNWYKQLAGISLDADITAFSTAQSCKTQRKVIRQHSLQKNHRFSFLLKWCHIEDFLHYSFQGIFSWIGSLNEHRKSVYSALLNSSRGKIKSWCRENGNFHSIKNFIKVHFLLMMSFSTNIKCCLDVKVRKRVTLNLKLWHGIEVSPLNSVLWSY